MVFSSFGAKYIDSFQEGTSNCMSCLSQMLVEIIQQSVAYSFPSCAISSCFWFPAPLLSQSCFLEIVYKKIAAEQLSFDCSFLFFISSTPSPYLSFISPPLLDFFLCFARGPFFAVRKSGLSRYFCPLDMCISGDAHAT